MCIPCQGGGLEQALWAWHSCQTVARGHDMISEDCGTLSSCKSLFLPNRKSQCLVVETAGPGHCLQLVGEFTPLQKPFIDLCWRKCLRMSDLNVPAVMGN